MKRAFSVCFIVVVLLIGFSVTAAAEAYTPVEDFTYTLKGAETVLLTKYTGTARSIAVPQTYLIDGVTCQVELASGTVFAGNALLNKVSVSSGVRFENNSMRLLFAKCTALSSVKLLADTSDVTDMSYLFYGCEALQELDLSGLNTGNAVTMEAMFCKCTMLKRLTGYENWDTRSLRSIAYMFSDTEKLKTVNLSRWTLAQLENSGWCFQNCGASKLLLPEDLAIISAGFLNHVANYAGSSFTVPSGVRKVGYAHTVYDFGTDDFTEFLVAQENSAYKAIDGILYSADGTEMLAIPQGKTFLHGIYEIPEGVTFLGELSFSRNYNVETVVLPDSYMLKYVPVNDPAYITFEDTGNLNAGLNLNIAIYRYTGIKSYEVKSSNPNYKSIDGILYTKDTAALVAVPTRYEGLLEIPEGVRQWNSAAMWTAGSVVDGLMKDCTGVYIPASMTEIAPDQLDKLNRLESCISAFEITVSDGNPVYYTGKSGQLLKRSNLEDVQITLPQDAFIYNGQPKAPEPTVVCDGKKLTVGKDYTLSYSDNVNAGTGWIRITGQGDYFGSVECAFTIEPAQPYYTIPKSLTARYGQTLREIALPKGFAWMQPEAFVGEVGTHTYTASYTKYSTNYVDVKDIQLTVLVLPKPLDGTNIYVQPLCFWTGNAVQPSVCVMDGDTVVQTGEYTVSYKDNLSLGKSQVALQDVLGGNYQVSGIAEFYIIPGPLLYAAALSILWCLTTGVTIMRDKKAERSRKPSKTR